MTTMQALRQIAQTLPPNSHLPVSREILLELLEKTSEEDDHRGTSDLTVDELARMFKRKASTVREWLARGLFPGAYKLHGKAWRVPIAAIMQFRQQQTIEPPAPNKATTSIDQRNKARGKLSDWRTSHFKI